MFPTLLAITAIVAVAIVAASGSGGSIRISSSGVNVDVEADDDFASVLQKSLDAERDSVEAILESKGYYSLSSGGLIAALNGVEVEAEGDRAVVLAFRRLLWNLEGPFAPPGTLLEADERLFLALEDLDPTRSDADEANAFLAEMWRRMLDQRGIFKQRAFPARVSLVRGAPTARPVAYACSGGALTSGRMVQIFVRGGGNELVEVAQDLARFPCDGAVTTRQLLTGKVPVRLGVSRDLYDRLFSPNGSPDRAATERDAMFAVYPKHLVGLHTNGGES